MPDRGWWDHIKADAFRALLGILCFALVGLLIWAVA